MEPTQSPCNSSNPYSRSQSSFEIQKPPTCLNIHTLCARPGALCIGSVTTPCRQDIQTTEVMGKQALIVIATDAYTSDREGLLIGWSNHFQGPDADVVRSLQFVANNCSKQKTGSSHFGAAFVSAADYVLYRMPIVVPVRLGRTTRAIYLRLHSHIG